MKYVKRKAWTPSWMCMVGIAVLGLGVGPSGCGEEEDRAASDSGGDADSDSDSDSDTDTDTDADADADADTDADASADTGVDTDTCTEPHAADPRFEAAAALEAEWCGRAQILIANLDPQLGDDDVVAVVYGNLSLFALSKPALLGAPDDPDDGPDAGPDGGLDAGLDAGRDAGQHEGPFAKVYGYLLEGELPCATSTPQELTTEIWCKAKTQGAFVDAFGMAAAGPEEGCAAVNAAALAWALEQLTPEERLAYETEGPSLVMESGQSYVSGNAWLNESAIELENLGGGTWALRSPGLRLGGQAWVPESLRDMSYCKLWSPARALAWVLDFE